MNIIVLPILKPQDEPILAGRLSGKRAFVNALESLSEMNGPALVLLDFKGVALATSSYLGEVLLPLRDHLRLRRTAGYVAVANLSDNVQEEIEEMLRRMGDALLTCTTDAVGRVNDVRLCGTLEHKLQETLSLVSRKGETTAAKLHKETHQVDPVGATAWNNRLTSLAAKSLLIEISQGRTKVYKPVLEVA